MEHLQHCEGAAASQSDLDTWINALWTKLESFDRQASKVRLDRDNEDLDEFVSRQREDEQIVKKRKVEDEDRIATRKYEDEQIVKKRKVEEGGHERVRAPPVEETEVSWLRYSTTQI
jgi:hypothetical protein